MGSCGTFMLCTASSSNTRSRIDAVEWSTAKSGEAMAGLDEYVAPALVVIHQLVIVYAYMLLWL